MNRVAGVALTTSAIFLLIVAVLLNSNALFYMSTAVIATIGASRIQAWLSVRGLRFERSAPEKAQAGEMVTVEITVWSYRRIRRPLVRVTDQLPARMVAGDRSKSLPVAPAFDIPIRTQYKFRPMRRGRFRWSSLVVEGTDALGLVTTKRTYQTETTEMLVVPIPIPLDFDLPAASGWGSTESEYGQARGAGIEPRGTREYMSGDSLRYVHWRSSARRGQLLVKEFETGSHAAVAFVIQRTKGTDIGEGANTTLERMCSHVAYLSERMLRTGAQVLLPTVELTTRPSSAPHERQQEVLAALAEIEPENLGSISQEVIEARSSMAAGSMIYALLAIKDPDLVGVARQVVGSGMRMVVLAYDPNHFLPPKKKTKLPAATDRDYLEALRSAGALVLEVPKQEIM